MAERIPPTQVYVNGQPIETEPSQNPNTVPLKTDTQFFFEAMRDIDQGLAQNLLIKATARKMSEVTGYPQSDIESAIAQSFQSASASQNQQAIAAEIRQISNELGLSPREPKKPSLIQIGLSGFNNGLKR